MKSVLAILLVVGLGVRVSADATGTITQLSSGSASDEQNTPVISGSLVVWTDVSTNAAGVTNVDVFLLNLTTGALTNLTNTPDAQEFLADVDGNTVVWTHTDTTHPGDIVAYDALTGTTSTVAASSNTVHFEQPAVHGHDVAFLRVSPTAVDVELLDLSTGTPTQVTNDAAVQSRPRVGDDVVVYEDYSNGNPDIQAYRISTGAHFPIATGPSNQIEPDTDGHLVVWVEESGLVDQIFAFDLLTGSTTQLTTAASLKVLPRISGNRVIWSDDRNGNLDLYMYDLSTGTEQALVRGAGDQFLPDIDGDRVVYTNNDTGFEQVFLFTFGNPTPHVGDLVNLVQSFNLKQGIANSLTAKLGSAQSAIARGDLATACGVLGAFINEVQAQTGKAITASQANQLIAMATALRSSLGC
jgi:beta propeller repeat protein